MPLGHKDYYVLEVLEKEQMQGEDISELALSAWRQILQKNSIVINSLFGSFINKGRLTQVSREETKSAPQPDRLCHKLPHFPSILLTAYSSFLKFIYFSQSDLYSSSLALIKTIYKLSNLIAFFGWSFLFFLWCPHACNIKK